MSTANCLNNIKSSKPGQLLFYSKIGETIGEDQLQKDSDLSL